MARQWSLKKQPGGPILFTHESDLEGSTLRPMTKWVDLASAIGSLAVLVAALTFMIWMTIAHFTITLFLAPFVILFWFFRREELKERGQLEH